MKVSKVRHKTRLADMTELESRLEAHGGAAQQVAKELGVICHIVQTGKREKRELTDLLLFGSHVCGLFLVWWCGNWVLGIGIGLLEKNESRSRLTGVQQCKCKVRGGSMYVGRLGAWVQRWVSCRYF